MRIIEVPPTSIEFKCFSCFGRFAVEKEDITEPAKVVYGQHWSMVICPICGDGSYIDWSNFPGSWTKLVKELADERERTH